MEKRTTFREKYIMLCNAYHQKYSKDSCIEYYKILKQYGEKKIDIAFKEAISRYKFFPSIAEINEIITNLPPNWFQKINELVEPTIEEKQEMKKILDEMEVKDV